MGILRDVEVFLKSDRFGPANFAGVMFVSWPGPLSRREVFVSVWSCANLELYGK